MSALSEALERQLRKILPPPPVVVSKKERILVVGDPTAAKPKTKSIHRSAQLAYQEGSSDKVYNVQILGASTTTSVGFVVNFQYGRRGKTLIEGTKTPTPVTGAEALNIYHNLVNEKLAKGYKGYKEI